MPEKRRGTRSGTQVDPHTVVFSLYGQYVLSRGDEIWIGSLIRALAALDIKAGATRTIVSRMQREGYLQGRRVGRRSFYRLTELGLKQVRGGGDRAFTPPGDEWDGQWIVITYTIPEEHRKHRDMLRSWLTWWAFGALAPGVWISPHPLSPEVEGKLQEMDVWQYLEVFRAEHLGPSDQRALVAHAWPQIPALGDRYQAYVARYERVSHHLKTGTLDDKACFVARFQSLYEFIAITLEDPALPPSLLPKDWPRPIAQALFKELSHALSERAERFFDAIYETAKGKGKADDERTRTQ
ncbi:MAG: PaaX family transcriptional regulator C-terminal domain-containing protein [Promethearchaeota archaeon]